MATSPGLMTWTLPNLITTGRLAAAPVLSYLLLQSGTGARLAAFVLFTAAAVSDVWDGYLARRRGQVTRYGIVADPIADKLLLAAALIPFYLLTRESPFLAGIPLFDVIPLWVLIVLLGREVVVTVLRFLALRRGRAVAARKSGKYKTVFQNLFLGAMILWLALRSGLVTGALPGGTWGGLEPVLGWFVSVTLAVALFLTVYSLAIYVNAFARLLTREAPG